MGIEDVIKPIGDGKVGVYSNHTLKDMFEAKIKELDISYYKAEEILGVERKTLLSILDNKAKRIDVINLIKLSHFLGIDINSILNIYVPSMPIEMIGEIQEAKDSAFIYSYFDVDYLKKLKVLDRKDGVKDIRRKLEAFLGLKSIYEYTRYTNCVVFSKTKRNSYDKVRLFWVFSAIRTFEYINNPNSYKREELIDLIPRIRPFTRDRKDGLIKVCKALYNVGVTVIFQPSIEKLQIRGATFSINNKPCIVISDLNKSYPTLWFTLMHEIHHVLYDFDEIKNRSIYHISDPQGDLFLLNEEKADNFAQEYLLSETRLRFIAGYINSNILVEKHAAKWGVDPSIIYSIYCYKTNQWAKYRKLIPSIGESVKLLNTHPFDRDSLAETALEVKETIYNH